MFKNESVSIFSKTPYFIAGPCILIFQLIFYDIGMIFLIE